MSDSTTLATLTKALSPKTGMQRIPFPTESYQHQSVPLSAKYLLNMYIEQEPSDARSDTALLPNSGAVYRETLGTGPVVAFDTTLVGGFYAVSGGHAFRNANGVTVDLGPVGTPSDPLVNPDHLMTTIACSPSDVVICVPPNAFTAQHGDPTLTQLTDVTHGFPGANSVTFIDGYFVFTQTGRGIQFFWSPLDSPLGPYDALSFANVEGMDNILLRVVTHQGELWFLGYAGIEVWHDVGDKDAPFQRLQGGVIPIGVLPRTVQTWTTRCGGWHRKESSTERGATQVRIRQRGSRTTLSKRSFRHRTRTPASHCRMSSAAMRSTCSPSPTWA